MGEVLATQVSGPEFGSMNACKAICMHNHSPGAREEAHSGEGNAQKLAGPLADLVYSV